MKKLTLALFTIASFTLVACHYGQDEAKETLKTNEQYKTDKKEYSTNNGNDGVMPNAENTKATSEKKDSTAAEATK